MKGLPTYDGHFTEGLKNDIKFAMSMVNCKRSGSFMFYEKFFSRQSHIISRIFRNLLLPDNLQQQQIVNVPKFNEENILTHLNNSSYG